MGIQTGDAEDDLLQVQKCLRGDLAALGSLRERFQGTLMAILRARGASLTEAEDTLADLWSDSVVADNGERLTLLEKYSGKCPLQAWLTTVATNRWYDVKRRQARGIKIMQAQSDPSAGTVPFEHLREGLPARSDDALVELLRDSLRTSFAACGAEAMVLLRLVYIHKLSQREIVRMLGWNETKVSRILSHAMQKIEADTLQEVKKRDSWLVLNWGDFLDLCQTKQIGFL